MLPIIAITMGDPCGIGPEIIGKALLHPWVYQECRPLIVGSAPVIEDVLKIIGSSMKIHRVRNVQEACFAPGVVDVLHQDTVDMAQLRRGQVQAMGGKAAFMAVQKTIDLALKKEADATVTAPLNKEALHLAGYLYSGHTEIYADLTASKQYAMMLVHDQLRVIHVSTHVSLREACQRCKKDRVLETVLLAWQACRSFGIVAPRIAVAGLNPHAGENGLFGREEIEEIIPAIRAAQDKGLNVIGPIPPDTVFTKAKGGMYDIVVAQYHDQGHIPLKLLGFRFDMEKNSWQSVAGVNITVGLPIIRTSVDHGTAFDQAGMGTASEESLLNAIRYAILMAQGSATSP